MWRDRNGCVGEERTDQRHFTNQKVFLFPRLTTLPIRLPPPVHTDPVEPTQGRICLHALALGAGVLVRATAGHTGLVVGLRGNHTVALGQVPSQSKETDMAFCSLGLLPKNNSNQPILTQRKPQGKDTTTNCSNKQYAHMRSQNDPHPEKTSR